MTRDGDQESAEGDQRFRAQMRQLTSPPKPRADERGVRRVTKEEAEHLSGIPLNARRLPADSLGIEDRVDVRHVSNGLQEVETKSDRRPVDDPIDDVVEVVSHDQKEEDNGGSLCQLFQQTCRE